MVRLKKPALKKTLGRWNLFLGKAEKGKKKVTESRHRKRKRKDWGSAHQMDETRFTRACWRKGVRRPSGGKTGVNQTRGIERNTEKKEKGKTEFVWA